MQGKAGRFYLMQINARLSVDGLWHRKNTFLGGPASLSFLICVFENTVSPTEAAIFSRRLHRKSVMLSIAILSAAENHIQIKKRVESAYYMGK